MNRTITWLMLGVIVLGMLLILAQAYRKEAQQDPAAPAAETARPQLDAPMHAPPARLPEQGLPAAAQAPSAPETRSGALPAPPARPAEGGTVSTEGVTVRTVPAQIDAGPAAVADAPQTATPVRPTTPRATPPVMPAMPKADAGQARGGGGALTSIVVYATQEGATLRLGGDRPLVYKSMLLRNPDRFVLDFEGQWNVNDMPGVPQNRIVKSVRIGRQADATRMVIDLHRAPTSYRLIKTSPRGLDVRLR